MCDFLSLGLRQEAEEQVLISFPSPVYLKRNRREGGARFFSKVHIVTSRDNQHCKRKSDEVELFTARVVKHQNSVQCKAVAHLSWGWKIHHSQHPELTCFEQALGLGVLERSSST